MENISDYTIHCTPEQIKLAMELGASIEQVYYNVVTKEALERYNLVLIEGKEYKIPTAEQMVGWLQSKGCYPYTMPLKRDGKVMIAARFEFFEVDGSVDTFCGYGEDNSVILKAIDKALTYLSNKK